MKRKFVELDARSQLSLVQKKLWLLRNQQMNTMDEQHKQELGQRIEKGEKLLSLIVNRLDWKERPSDAEDCHVCGGTGEAATKSSFIRGKRKSVMVGFCSFCLGKGYLEEK